MQGCIKLIKSDSEDIYIVTKLFFSSFFNFLFIRESLKK